MLIFSLLNTATKTSICVFPAPAPNPLAQPSIIDAPE